MGKILVIIDPKYYQFNIKIININDKYHYNNNMPVC